MAYFDGGLHGWNGPNGYVPAKPQTKLYCDVCAETQIPLQDKSGPRGQRHWDTGFRWAPRYGASCDCCGKEC